MQTICDIIVVLIKTFGTFLSQIVLFYVVSVSMDDDFNFQ